MNRDTGKCNKICGRLCVELKGHLASPLSISSGEQERTDADVILDETGQPMIPGSSLAGALLAYSRGFVPKEDLYQLFGAPRGGKPGSSSDRQSRLFCYDTVLKDGVTGIRDGVKLGENKTSVHKSKYEIQMIERDAKFRIRIELIQRQECLTGKGTIQDAWNWDLRWIKRWIQGFNTGELRIGGKANRGFGMLRIESARFKQFHMEESEEYLNWLNWHWDDKDAFKQAENIDPTDDIDSLVSLEHVLEVPLRIPYTLLVRSYSTAFTKADSLPDYGQMTVKDEGEQAVIPGTSLAGAFRSHIARIVKQIAHLENWEKAQQKLEEYFGTWVTGEKQEDQLQSSRIVFEEIKVDGGHGLPQTRNAIDRFTGGTIKGALFEETPWTGGTCMLRIRWKRDEKEDDIICGLLLWAVLDLLSGILPIGGETAIGRGIFCGQDKEETDILLDGEAMKEQKKEGCMQAAAAWCRGGENGTVSRSI
ncbi:MAG: RAMP superfamily CRISPR-associated protein [Faecalicatena sp.]|uniref:RAMP superfamily CRISPR-associated protein n=1 Tax=Faecalicatena sp. TaxID=2005360 RepID=UPI00258F2082|nr:RAMP superfamily CRISPR-associated protein [Faecalicatena sp.]MCI6465069.1 RAMP superfamily CRISPR-associated protein [Faecalicatena sp.]MDY5617100.1 RAMP superfamily CRISPR-associated protein [Lachnospiraceae bacterium]